MTSNDDAATHDDAALRELLEFVAELDRGRSITRSEFDRLVADVDLPASAYGVAEQKLENAGIDILDQEESGAGGRRRASAHRRRFPCRGD